MNSTLGSVVPLAMFKFLLPKSHLESLPDCQNVFCTQLELYIFAEMTSLSGLTKDKKSNVT